jgi:hypothetical protein
MNSLTKAPEAPIAGEGGVAAPFLDQRDPYQALDELMVVVEALCPTWPPRTATAAGVFKL